MKHPARLVARVSLTASAATGIPGWFIAGSIWTGAGLCLVVFGLWFILEGALYFHQQPPITPYVRTWRSQHLVLAVCVGLALVAGSVAAFVHFILDPTR